MSEEKRMPRNADEARAFRARRLADAAFELPRERRRGLTARQIETAISAMTSAIDLEAFEERRWCAAMVVDAVERMVERWPMAEDSDRLVSLRTVLVELKQAADDIVTGEPRERRRG